MDDTNNKQSQKIEALAQKGLYSDEKIISNLSNSIATLRSDVQWLTYSIYELSAQKQFEKTKNNAIVTLQHLQQRTDSDNEYQSGVKQLLTSVDRLSLQVLLTAQTNNKHTLQIFSNEQK